MPKKRLIAEVLNFKQDAAVESAPVIDEDLWELVLNIERLVAVMPKQTRSLEELLDQRHKAIVFAQGFYFRFRLETRFANNSINSYQKIVMNSNEGVINFIESGIRISILPKVIIDSFYTNREIKFFELGDEIGTVNNILIYRKIT